MTTRYNHAFDIAFSVVSEDPTGEDVTAEQVREALISRVNRAYESGELLEAIGAPFDTYEVDEPPLTPSEYDLTPLVDKHNKL